MDNKKVDNQFFMTDDLYKLFRIYLMEGLLGVEPENVFEYLAEKGYMPGSAKRTEAIAAYNRVTNDPVLSTLIPELPSYDLNHEGTDIKTLYSVRKKELYLKQQEQEKEEAKVTDESKKDDEEAARTNDSAADFAASMKEINSKFAANQEAAEKIEETQAAKTSEPTITPDVPMASGETVKPPQKGLILSNSDVPKNRKR